MLVNYRPTLWQSPSFRDFSFLLFLTSCPLSLSLFFFFPHFYIYTGEHLPHPPHAHLSFAHYGSRHSLKRWARLNDNETHGPQPRLIPRSFQVPSQQSLEGRKSRNPNPDDSSCAHYSHFQLPVSVRVTGTSVTHTKDASDLCQKVRKDL